MPRFDEARRAALMGDLLRHARGLPTELLPFEEVREGMALRSLVDRGIHDVPLDRVVGTMGREHEFNRAFLPREEALRGRWEEVERLAEGPRGFPPVELYQVGDVYFVVDGHHRVSVARAHGLATIEARVKEFLTPLPLAPDVSLDEVISRRGLADFLVATGLVPESDDDFRVTEPGGYERLLQHIAGHRWYRGLETRRSVPWDEAARSWHESVYRPMVRTIRASGVLEEFPGRTETDLYLFTMDHLYYLRQRYAPDAVEPRRAVEDFARTQAPPGPAPPRRLRWPRWLRRGRKS